jgi:hypothetical protein
MKLIISLAALLVLPMTCHAQAITSGVILPENEQTFNSCCVYIPSAGIYIYNKPKGEIIGKIELSNSTKDKGLGKYNLKINGQSKPLDSQYLEVVKGEIKAIKYVGQKLNFIKIYNDYWISISELKEKGLRMVNSMQYLIEKSPDVLGYYAVGSGLNLRKSPSTQSELMMTLKGDLLEIKLTEETNGFWCKVVVTKYSDHPCTSKGNFDEIKLQTFTGWIKLLSDDQTPNVTYYKGC